MSPVFGYYHRYQDLLREARRSDPIDEHQLIHGEQGRRPGWKIGLLRFRWVGLKNQSKEPAASRGQLGDGEPAASTG